MNIIATLEAVNKESGGDYEGRFDIVLAAITSAGLTGNLQGEALFTVRAYTVVYMQNRTYSCLFRSRRYSKVFSRATAHRRERLMPEVADQEILGMHPLPIPK